MKLGSCPFIAKDEMIDGFTDGFGCSPVVSGR